MMVGFRKAAPPPVSVWLEGGPSPDRTVPLDHQPGGKAEGDNLTNPHPLIGSEMRARKT